MGVSSAGCYCVYSVRAQHDVLTAACRGVEAEGYMVKRDLSACEDLGLA